MITCTPKNLPKEVRFDSLKTGDTFIYRVTPYIIAERNGHAYPVRLTDGKGFDSIRKDTMVTPIDCEMLYTFR